MRTAPVVGIVGCLLVLVGLAVPYAAPNPAPGWTPGLYYGEGAVSPLVAGLFALLTAMILGAGREERTDPLLAAGVGLALGLMSSVILLLWAVTVPQDVVVGISTAEVVTQHRWLVTVVSLVVPASSAWWARALGAL